MKMFARVCAALRWPCTSVIGNSGHSLEYCPARVDNNTTPHANSDRSVAPSMLLQLHMQPAVLRCDVSRTRSRTSYEERSTAQPALYPTCAPHMQSISGTPRTKKGDTVHSSGQMQRMSENASACARGRSGDASRERSASSNMHVYQPIARHMRSPYAVEAGEQAGQCWPMNEVRRG